jgi:hypothetical protein
LTELDNLKNIESLGLYFVVQHEKCGEILSDELMTNGSDIPVTNGNYKEYINKR